MVGIGYDFATTDVTTLIAPHLLSIHERRRSIYVESWIQLFVNPIFADDGLDTLYTRNFVLYKAAGWLRINEETGITSLPIGGRINLNHGENTTLGIFLGSETEAVEAPTGRRSVHIPAPLTMTSSSTRRPRRPGIATLRTPSSQHTARYMRTDA